MSNRLLIPGVVLCGLAVTSLAAESAKPRKTVDKQTVRLLLSKDFAAQDKAKQQILEERTEMISELTAIIADPENHAYRPESVRKAMSVLGEYRAVEGIEVLVTYIGFPWVHHPHAEEYPGPPGGGKNMPPLKGSPFASRWLAEQFPAIPALTNIGEPCVDAVIAKLSTTDHIVEQTVCTEVLKNLQQHPSVCEKLEGAIKEGKARHPEVLRKALETVRKDASEDAHGTPKN